MEQFLQGNVPLKYLLKESNSVYVLTNIKGVNDWALYLSELNIPWDIVIVYIHAKQDIAYSKKISILLSLSTF